MGSIWPEAKASAASSRVLSLVDAFLHANFAVIFSADGRENEATEALRRQGVKCVRIAPNSSEFDTFVAGLQPTVCIFDRFITEEKFGWRVQQYSPETMRILDTIDLHFLRFARQKLVAKNLMNELSWDDVVRDASDIMPRELAAILRSDLSLLVSDEEIRILKEQCCIPEDLLMLCRLTYPPLIQVPDFSSRTGFAMIGNFLHPPNEDAVRWVREEIWPKLRSKIPEATLDIWGAHAAAKHIALSNPEHGFVVHGYVEDQFSVLGKSRVNLAPLRFGAGIKGKIADGWFMGTPAVTTSIGIEGMTGKEALGGIVANSVRDIVDAAVELYNNEDLWLRCSQEGRDTIANLYSPKVTVTPVIDKVSLLRDSLSDARTRNVLGRILWQQGLRSTEYFSRWIECKNKVLNVQRQFKDQT